MELNGKTGGAATLTEALHDRIRQDIILGALQPSSKLKLEKLSKTYGASVNTLRESLSRLAADGLVVVEGQKGFAVLPVSMQDLREITEMRQMLECHALRQSIANADLDWEARLVGAYHKLSKVEALVEAEPELYGDAWERYNLEFHEALIANCQSRWLKLFHRAMYRSQPALSHAVAEDQAFPEIAIGRGASANSRRGDPPRHSDGHVLNEYGNWPPPRSTYC